LPFFKSLSELGDYKIFKEREFMATISATVIDENAHNLDKIIMQGVVDLCVICTDEIYILDYKTGKFSEEKLENYKFQINTYAEIIEQIFEKKVTKKLICFIDEKNMVIC
jgi:ATP-dependent helicase/nuclease subunit A